MIPHIEREKKLEEATKIQQDIIERLKADLKMATNAFRPAPQGPSSQRVRFQEQNSDLDLSLIQQLGDRLDTLVIGQQAQINRNMGTQIKLPNQLVPTFSGDTKQYPDWWARFSRLVHTNSSINHDTIKFTYLKEALKRQCSSNAMGNTMWRRVL
jgi:hypothetical protein